MSAFERTFFVWKKSLKKAHLESYSTKKCL